MKGQGVTVGGTEHIIGLFVDDIIIFLEQPDICFPHLMSLPENYKYYSGYKLNGLSSHLFRVPIRLGH